MNRIDTVLICTFLLAAAMCPAQEPAPAPINYSVEFSGLDETGLRSAFRDVSQTVELRGEAVESSTQLRRRMNDDIETFQKLLRAEGYYEHEIETEVVAADGARTARFSITTGPRFTFEKLTITTADGNVDEDLPSPSVVSLVTGEPALAESVTSANTRILNHLRHHGFPFPTMQNRQATVDFETHTMDVHFVVDPGPKAGYGELEIEGFDKVAPVVTELERPWEPGELYDSRQLDTLRNRLYESGLFTVVRVQPLQPVENERVNIRVEVTERKHRTIGTGASFHSDRGLGTEFFWEHRNLWGRGRKLRVKTNLAQEEQSFDITLTVDPFKRRNQRLRSSVFGGFEDTDAFESQEIGGRITIERKLHQHIWGGAGFAVRFTEVEQLKDTEIFQLFSFPLELAWDNTDDALDPKRGVRVTVRTEPFFDVLGEKTEFLKSQLTASYYVSLDDESNWVFAHRVKVGSIVGEATQGVPADERFYAGGGGSVRGYPFQSIGPLFADEEPIGGLSVFETAVELRYRINESFGVAAFVDGGSAFESKYPDFDNTLRWGAGVGLRYYSPIGPFRFDVAVPLNRDDHIDENFQVYLSLGQSF